jgi:uncharacterized protein (DUF2249 family)
MQETDSWRTVVNWSAGCVPFIVTPLAQRHPLIFGAYESLAAGETSVLVNDHDPKPLYYQFAAERSGQFTWDYLEQGPSVWRVRISKVG